MSKMIYALSIWAFAPVIAKWYNHWHSEPEIKDSIVVGSHIVKTGADEVVSEKKKSSFDQGRFLSSSWWKEIPEAQETFEKPSRNFSGDAYMSSELLFHLNTK